MVNGTLSRILYIGALVIVGMCLGGSVLLAMTNGAELPGDAKLALYTCLGFLFGSHVVPPTVKKVTGTIAGKAIGAEPPAVYTKRSDV